MAKNITIEKKGDYLKVKRNDIDTVHRYLLVDLTIKAENKKFIIEENGSQVEDFHYNEVQTPEANSFSDLLDLVHDLITPVAVAGTLNGLLGVTTLEFDISLSGSAQTGITGSRNFPYLLFDDIIQESARVYFPAVPDNFDPATDPEVRFKVAPSDNQDTIASKTFMFQLDLKYISENEKVNKADDETLTTVISISTVYATMTDVAITLDGSKIKAKDLIVMKITRLTNDPGDTRNGDAEISVSGLYFREL